MSNNHLFGLPVDLHLDMLVQITFFIRVLQIKLDRARGNSVVQILCKSWLYGSEDVAFLFKNSKCSFFREEKALKVFFMC